MTKLKVSHVSDAALSFTTFYLSSSSSYSYSSSNEQADLGFVKALLQGYGFNEGKDKEYLQSRHGLETTFSFLGKLNRFRAFWSIPLDQIEFGYDCPRNQEKKQKYLFARYQHAAAMSATECTDADRVLVQKANNEFFLDIKSAVEKYRPPYMSSSVMSQLIADLNYIEQQQTEDLFARPKYYLAFCSFYAAFLREETEKTVRKSHFGIFKGASVLTPVLRNLLTAVWSILPQYKEKPTQELIAHYDAYVKARPSPVAHESIAAAFRSLPPAASVSPMRTTDGPDLTRNILYPLMVQLSNRKAIVENRITQNHWWQDRAKNQNKLRAITNIEIAFNAGQTGQDLFDVFANNRDDLVQSTSALPRFFRSKVTTAEALRPYAHMMIPSR